MDEKLKLLPSLPATPAIAYLIYDGEQEQHNYNKTAF